jgi:hypothetical protein
MERYAGLGSHARSCTLGVMSAGGQRLKSLVVETNGRALVEAVRGIGGRVHLCLEEGTQSAWLYERLKPHVEWLGRQLDQLEPLREEAEPLLLGEAKKHPIIRKLSTAPGMGPIRTAQVVAIVATPERFRTRRQFWSYSGLGIVTRSSADWVQDRTGKWVRAQHAQTRGLSRKRHPRLKAARKIAATVLSMWKHQEVYDPKRHHPTPEQKQVLGSGRRAAVRLRTPPLENGSGESIHCSAGVPDAMGRPLIRAMPPRSADLSDGPRRPFQEHGAPVVREGRRYCFTLQRRVRPNHTPRQRRTGMTPTVSPLGSGARRQGLSRSTTIRPLLELARAAGRTLLLATHS